MLFESSAHTEELGYVKVNYSAARCLAPDYLDLKPDHTSYRSHDQVLRVCLLVILPENDNSNKKMVKTYPSWNTSGKLFIDWLGFKGAPAVIAIMSQDYGWIKGTGRRKPRREDITPKNDMTIFSSQSCLQRVEKAVLACQSMCTYERNSERSRTSSATALQGRFPRQSPLLQRY